jgi:hypothetical protein
VSSDAQQSEHALRVTGILGFLEDVFVQNNDGVRSENQFAIDGGGLRTSQP